MKMSSLSSSGTMVYLTFCHCCPIWVLSNSGKNLVMAAAVSLGKVVRLPLLMAFKKVCKNVTTFSIDGNLCTLWKTLVGTGWLMVSMQSIMLVTWSIRGTLHRPGHPSTLGAMLPLWQWIRHPLHHGQWPCLDMDEKLSYNHFQLMFLHSSGNWPLAQAEYVFHM